MNLLRDHRSELPYEKTPLIGKWIKNVAIQIDTAVKNNGLSKGIRKVIEDHGGRIQVEFGSKETINLINTSRKPLVIVCTHASLAEPLAVLAALSNASQRNQDEIFLMVADGFPQYPSLNKYGSRVD